MFDILPITKSYNLCFTLKLGHWVMARLDLYAFRNLKHGQPLWKNDVWVLYVSDWNATNISRHWRYYILYATMSVSVLNFFTFNHVQLENFFFQFKIESLLGDKALYANRNLPCVQVTIYVNAHFQFTIPKEPCFEKVSHLWCNKVFICVVLKKSLIVFWFAYCT